MALGMREVGYYQTELGMLKTDEYRNASQVSQKEYDDWKGGWDAAGVLLKGREEALDR